MLKLANITFTAGSKSAGGEMLAIIRDRRGFSLIELLIVVAIIAIVAAIAIPQYSAYLEKAYNTAASADLNNWKSGLEAYYADKKTYPAAYDTH